MILWFILFLIIVIISFILAYQSMRDFQEKPFTVKGVENSLFLIRHPQNFTIDMLTAIHGLVLTEKHIISIERLVKGTRSALVIFGPKQLLQSLTLQLHLLELEEYAKMDRTKITAWEMGVKDPFFFHTQPLPEVFTNLPTLQEDEQFWLQMVLQPTKEGWQIEGNKLIKEPLLDTFMRIIGFPIAQKSYHLAVKKTVVSDPNIRNLIIHKSMQKAYQVQMRAVVVSFNDQRRKELVNMLENIAPSVLVKIPKPISSTQMFDLYQERSIPSANMNPLIFTTEEIYQLILK